MMDDSLSEQRSPHRRGCIRALRNARMPVSPNPSVGKRSFFISPGVNGKTRQLPMMALAKKTAILLIGWTFIVLGVLGLFLPILQGVLFLLIGLLVLSKESTVAKSILGRVEKRYPSQYRKMHEFNDRIKKRFWQLVKS